MWRKIIGPTILVSVLWIAASSITTCTMHWLDEYHARVLADNVATIRDAWAMQDALWRLQAVVVESGDKDRPEVRVEVAELERAFERHLAEAEKTSLTEEEQILAKAARDHFAVYRDHIQRRLQPTSLTELLASQATEKEKTMRLARAVAEPCRQLIDLNERLLALSISRTATLRTAINAVRFTFLVLGPIAGVLCGLWVARGLRRSISQISVTLRDAAGELQCDVGSVDIHQFGDLPGLQRQVQTVAARIRQVVEELQHTRRQAIAAERLASVGELAAGVAHELRNPLTSVKLLIQTVKRQVHHDAARKQLQVAQREIARIETTIQDLLDFAKPPALHRVPHDLRATVQRALNLVEGRARQQGVVITERLPRDPVMVNGDPEQLHQVLVNLLLNGIEAMPDGGTLEIAVEEDNAESGVCRVCVSDRGSGIPPPVLNRIFEPFVTSKESGTGLGLAVSHRIAREHGGALLAANREEGGAVFTLELPLRS
jgi:two-component system sensor histidine kinase HydH